MSDRLPGHTVSMLHNTNIVAKIAFDRSLGTSLFISSRTSCARSLIACCLKILGEVGGPPVSPLSELQGFVTASICLAANAKRADINGGDWNASGMIMCCQGFSWESGKLSNQPIPCLNISGDPGLPTTHQTRPC
jgi:hypothetical protein